MKHTIEVKGPDGDVIELEVEELDSVEIMEWAARAPNELISTDERAELTPEVVKFLIEFTVAQTVLTRDLLGEIDRGQLNRLFNLVVAYSFGNGDKIEYDKELGGSDYRVDDGDTVEFNDDGSVDLEDWR